MPLEETDGNARTFPPQRAEMQGDRDSRARILEKRSSAWDLQSDSETAKHRRTSMRANNSVAGKKRSRQALRDKAQQQDEKQKKRGDGYDDSAWIHRDKLAQIEIQEMAEAGIYMRPSRRSVSLGPGREDGRTSRSQSRPGSRRQAQERLEEIGRDEEYRAAYPSQEEYERQYQRVTSPVANSPVANSPQDEVTPRSPQRKEPQYAHEHTYSPEAEFRPPEEPTSELYSYKQMHNARPSTSRIPVSRISPAPVPQQVVERDSPAPRSRAGSQSLSGSWEEMQNARQARSGSVSSAVLLDDPDVKRITPPGSSSKNNSSNEGDSPPKSRMPKKPGPAGRKTSIPSAVATRPGSSSGKRAPSAQATKRPGSSSGPPSGHKSRPSTGHYPPEGEAPWIATMYKPDPRLPPDQQMLPTHAKRMMQEQWERDGKTGTVYDKDFRLLNDEEIKPPLSFSNIDFDHNGRVSPGKRSPSPKKELSPNGSVTANGWPLTPKSDTGSVRPGTSGGYKITPTIPSTPTIQRSSAASPVQAQPTVDHPPHNPTPRVPELDEKEESTPKKGCCCVVM